MRAIPYKVGTEVTAIAVGGTAGRESSGNPEVPMALCRARGTQGGVRLRACRAASASPFVRSMTCRAQVASTFSLVIHPSAIFANLANWPLGL